MNEHRKPVEIWTVRLPQNTGKKLDHYFTSKIELFPLYFWAQHWEPGSSHFLPKLPLATSARKDAWESLYRIRVDGKWVSGKAKYTGFTKQQICDRYLLETKKGRL